jgi:hypothetical protein
MGESEGRCNRGSQGHAVTDARIGSRNRQRDRGGALNVWHNRGVLTIRDIGTSWVPGVASHHTPCEFGVSGRRYPVELQPGMQRPSDSAMRRPVEPSAGCAIDLLSAIGYRLSAIGYLLIPDEPKASPVTLPPSSARFHPNWWTDSLSLQPFFPVVRPRCDRSPRRYRSGYGK